MEDSILFSLYLYNPQGVGKLNCKTEIRLAKGKVYCLQQNIVNFGPAVRFDTAASSVTVTIGNDLRFEVVPKARSKLGGGAAGPSTLQDTTCSSRLPPSLLGLVSLSSICSPWPSPFPKPSQRALWETERQGTLRRNANYVSPMR
jgi:hypothetical protein